MQATPRANERTRLLNHPAQAGATGLIASSIAQGTQPEDCGTVADYDRSLDAILPAAGSFAIDNETLCVCPRCSICPGRACASNGTRISIQSVTCIESPCRQAILHMHKASFKKSFLSVDWFMGSAIDSTTRPGTASGVGAFEDDSADIVLQSSRYASIQSSVHVHVTSQVFWWASCANTAQMRASEALLGDGQRFQSLKDERVCTLCRAADGI